MSSKEFVKAYDLGVAYPTILIAVTAYAVYFSSSVAAIQGHLNIWVAIILNSIAAYLLFTPMHEAGHMNISGKNRSLRWLDNLIGWLSGIPLFAPYPVFKVIHFRHHSYTNHPEKDPDHWLASKSPISLLFHAATIFPVYMYQALQLLFWDKKLNETYKTDLRKGLVGLAALIFLFIASTYVIGFTNVLILWIVPAGIAQVLLAFAFDWLPHHPHLEQARYRNTRVVDLPGLTTLLLGQNYHLVHHLYPRIPFYDYHKVYATMSEEVNEQGVEVISLKKASQAAT